MRLHMLLATFGCSTSSLVLQPRLTRRSALAAAVTSAVWPAAIPAAHAQQLEFTKTSSCLKYAEIKPGNGDEVDATSRVTFHVKGRLVGKQGWVRRHGQLQPQVPSAEQQRLMCSYSRARARLGHRSSWIRKPTTSRFASL